MEGEGSWRSGLDGYLGDRPSAYDLRSSSRLVFVFLWSTIASGMLDGF